MFKKITTYICMFLVGGIGFFGISTEQNNKGPQNIPYNIYLGVDIFAEIQTDLQRAAINPGSDNRFKSTSSQDATIAEMMNKLITAWNIALGLLTAIVSPAILLASWLMSPDWTSGDLFGIRPLIHDLWIMVSNVTYFIYAILLIFIALATIFNSDKYGYKQLLPKLALGILMVPLSWWFIQFTISLSSIVTASVMNIPMEVLKSNMSSNPDIFITRYIPKNIKTDLSLKNSTKSTKCPSKDSSENQNNCISAQEVLASAGGIYSPLLIYGYAIFKVDEIKQLNSWSDYVKEPLNVLHQVIFGSIMFLIFGLLIIALIFMLMVRAIKLWFYAIFSPLMTLRYVIGDAMFKEDKSGSFDIKEFIGLAFVPALVGLSLSFGLMIVSMMTSSKPGGSSLTTTAPCTSELIQSTTGCELAGIMGVPENKIIRRVEGTGDKRISINEIKIGGITWEFRGKLNSITDAVESSNGTTSVLSAAGGIFGTLIIDIIALIFIWVAFMAAKNVSKAVSAIVQPFEDMGKKIGGLAMSLPKYAPILPGGISISGANKLVERASSIPEEASTKKVKDSALGKIFGMNGEADITGRKKVEDRVANNKEESVRIRGDMAKENLALMIKDGDKYIDNSKAHNDLMKAYKEHHKTLYGIEDALKSNGMDAGIAKKMAEKIFNDKTTSDPEVIKLWKESATKSGTGSTSHNASLYNVTITSDGKGFNIGTVRINESLDADVTKIADKLKISSLNKGITENDLKETLRRGTTQFGGNEKRMAELIEKLGKEFFKEQKAEEPKKS